MNFQYLKTSCLFFSFFVAIAAYSQNYTFSSTIYNVSEAGTPFELIAEGTVTNNTSETLNLYWERTVNDIPPCWLSAVFGVWIVALPHVDELYFDVAPNSTETFNVYVYPGASGPTTSGEGQVVLHISNLNDAADTLNITYNFELTGAEACVLNVEDFAKSDLNIYPNPTNQYFQISEELITSTISILDISGIEIKSFEAVANNKYLVHDLPHGVYFVRIKDRISGAIYTRRLIIQ